MAQSLLDRETDHLIAGARIYKDFANQLVAFAPHLAKHIGIDLWDKLSARGQASVLTLTLKHNIPPREIIDALKGGASNTVINHLALLAHEHGARQHHARGGYAEGGLPSELPLPGDDPGQVDPDPQRGMVGLRAAAQDLKEQGYFDPKVNPRLAPSGRPTEAGLPQVGDDPSPMDRAVQQPDPQRGMVGLRAAKSDLEAQGYFDPRVNPRLAPSGRPTEAGLPQVGDDQSPIDRAVQLPQQPVSGHLDSNGGAPLFTRAAPTDKPDYDNTPLPPRRPGDLGQPATDADGNAIQRAGSAVSGALTQGVENARGGVHNFLNALSGFESSGRNVYNVNQSTSSGRAGGYYQITSGTWQDFAPRAGVDLSKYPDAVSAPKEVQAAVAANIPMKRWDPITLRKLQADGWHIDPHKTMAENARLNGDADPRAFRADASPGADPDAVAALRVARQIHSIADTVGQGVGQGARAVGDTAGSLVGPALKYASDAGSDAGGWFGKNESWIIPVAKGVGSMLASRSPWLGNAIGEGMVGGATGWADEQTSLANRARTQGLTGETAANTLGINADTQRKLIENARGVLFPIHGPNGDVVMGWAVDKDGNMRPVPYLEMLQNPGKYPGMRLASPEEAANFSRSGTRPAAPAPVNAPATYGPGVVTPGAVVGGGGGAPAFPPIAPSGGGGASTFQPGGGGAFTPRPAPPAAATPKPAAPQVSPIANPVGFPQTSASPVGGLGYSYSDKSRNIMASDSSIAQSPVAAESGKRYVNETTAAGESATTAAPVLRELFGVATNAANQGGFVVPGAGSAQRMQLASAWNTLGRALGYKEDQMLTQADTNDALLQKQQAFLAAMATHGADQNSLGALQSLMHAFPNLGMPPKALATVTGQLMMQNQQARDRYDHYMNALDEGGMFTSYAKANRAYNAEYPSRGYDDMSAQLSDIVQNRQKLVHDIQAGMPREKAEAVLKKLGYAPGLSRVFY